MQATLPPTPPAIPGIEPARSAPSAKVDLGDVASCPTPASANGDIVVCGNRDVDTRYRLTLPDEPDDRQLRIQLPGGGTMTPHVQQGRMGEAQAVVTLSIPLGKKKDQ